MKPQNPYVRLVQEVRAWICQVKYPRTKHLWTYPKEKLCEGWGLADLYERIKAADTLGYDVIAIATDSGVEMKYRKRPDDPPWAVRQ